MAQNLGHAKNSDPFQKSSVAARSSFSFKIPPARGKLSATRVTQLRERWLSLSATAWSLPFWRCSTTTVQLITRIVTERQRCARTPLARYADSDGDHTIYLSLGSNLGDRRGESEGGDCRASWRCVRVAKCLRCMKRAGRLS